MNTADRAYVDDVPSPTPRVLVCPSWGSKESRQHWAASLDKAVPFEEEPFVHLLPEAHLRALRELHPEGAARFWGARPRHDKKMAPVRTGDVALFTGGKQVRAIAEVGAVFRCSGFADAVWPPKPGKDSWHTVYSLRQFVPVQIPYPVLCELAGYRSNFEFPGQLVLSGEKARSVVEGLRITTYTALEGAGAGKPGVPIPESTRHTALERQHTSATTIEQAAATVLYKREEQPLVAEFCSTLPGVTASRYYCPAGVCDIYLQGPEGVELVEAKSRTGHTHIREALAQLLDYAPHSPRPADRLAVLVPAALDDRELSLLHRYGVDCIQRTAPGVFDRLPAPENTRNAMRERWSDHDGRHSEHPG